MRIALACVGLVVATLALAGCTVQVPGTASPSLASVAVPESPSPTPLADPPSNEGRFTDAQGRFSLVPPTSWTADTSGAQGTAVVFLDPQPSSSVAGRFSSNINVLVVQSSADLSATVLGARQELLGLTAYASTVDEQVTLGDGTAAHMLGGSFTDPGTGLTLRNVQLFTVHSGMTLVATGTSLQDVWSAYEQTFQTSLRSLTVAD
jgi:hypothetical protein